jgi:ketosteroid isomerase-like protein
MSSRTAETMDRYRDAWSKNDWDAATAIWADDVVHHVPGRHRLSGTFQGKQAFLDGYREVFEDLGGTIEVVEFHDLLTSEEHAVALVRERAIRGAHTLDFDRVVVYHTRDHRIVETWSYDFDPYALDEFWAT